MTIKELRISLGDFTTEKDALVKKVESRDGKYTEDEKTALSGLFDKIEAKLKEKNGR